MSVQTQRWMRRELDQLLAQRARYVQAEAASRDVHQKVQHTTQRLRLNEEILGRQQALRALERHAADARAEMRDRGLRRSRPVTSPATSPAATPMPSGAVDRLTLPLALGVCIATFCLGFVLTGSALSSKDDASPALTPTPITVETPRYRRLAPPTPTPPTLHRDDSVMAASARPTASAHR